MCHHYKWHAHYSGSQAGMHLKQIDLPLVHTHKCALKHFQHFVYLNAHTHHSFFGWQNMKKWFSDASLTPIWRHLHSKIVEQHWEETCSTQLYLPCLSPLWNQHSQAHNGTVYSNRAKNNIVSAIKSRSLKSFVCVCALGVSNCFTIQNHMLDFCPVSHLPKSSQKYCFFRLCSSLLSFLYSLSAFLHRALRWPNPWAGILDWLLLGVLYGHLIFNKNIFLSFNSWYCLLKKFETSLRTVACKT